MKNQNRIWTEAAGAMVYPALFVVLLWLIKITEVYFNLELAEYGLVPRHLIGLRGILFAPLIHSDFAHLLSNTFPVLILGTMVFYFYPRSAREVWIAIYLLSGIWVWAGARVAVHIGASGLIYGFATFLVFSGIFRREKFSIAISLLVILFYGSMIWGVFPIVPDMSWESHLLGGLAGALCAWLYRGRDVKEAEVPVVTYVPEEDYLPWNQYDGPEGNPLPPPVPEEPPVIIIHYIPGKEQE